ncbi:hypothetical protein OIU85_021011 [Salix viminalis]|uniref:Growth-regulating factor n=1 Tax=Salix viminalis TaxID=40686 RepID=A0A9Q0UHE9_SALVM|nr:hypothetical protein OIU85_021011 [Salix viminalis]
MDDWPKSHSDRSAVSWPEPDMQYERTQLSISPPMATTDFMPSTSSPNNEKTTLPPLRLSREFDPIQMGLGVGVGSSPTGVIQKSAFLSNSSAGSSPRAENKINEVGNLCNDLGSTIFSGWLISDRGLQKSAFSSLSNSSAGSSPRAENKINEVGNLCNGLRSTIVHSSSLPALSLSDLPIKKSSANARL